MAWIDKIYGTREQRRELKRFIRRSRLPGYRKRTLYRYFYPPSDTHGPLTNFPAWADRWLWRQPYLPGWVRERLREQYSSILARSYICVKCGKPLTNTAVFVDSFGPICDRGHPDDPEPITVPWVSRQ